MKKILLIMHDMASGGAQKSLLSLLLEMADQQADYELSLLLIKKEGLFYEQLPAYVKLVEPDRELVCMQQPLLSKAFWRAVSWQSLLAKIKWQFQQKRQDQASFAEKQRVWWQIWQKVIPPAAGYYDTAVSYLQGYTNYYLADKVQASKKIMWIHTRYTEQGRDLAYDRQYFAKADRIVVVSSSCATYFLEIFPEFTGKVQIIPNLSSASLIWQLAQTEQLPAEYKAVSGWILLSIGRLSYEKGFDLALAAASILKKAGYYFKWFFIGKGPLLASLRKESSRLGLEEYVAFLGEKANPYVYLHHADIFVQTSRIEGKSLVLDEAKILAKPILVTAYDTVHDNIKDGQEGLVVDISSAAVAAGLKSLFDDPALAAGLTRQLRQLPDDTAADLAKYLQLFS